MRRPSSGRTFFAAGRGDLARRDRVVVLAQARHRAAEIGRRARQMKGRARRLDGPLAHPDGHDGVAVAEHRPVEHLLHVGHDGEGQALLERCGKPFLGGAVEEARHEARLQLVGARQPLRPHDELRMAAEVGHAHQVAERLPLRRRHDGDADPALLAAIDAHRIGRREAVEAPTLLRRAGRPGLDRLVLGQRDGGLVHAHLVAPALPAEQRRHGRNEGGEPAHDGRLVVGQGERRAFFRSDELHEARQRAAHRVAGLVVAIGAGPAEPGEIDGDEMGVCARSAPEESISPSAPRSSASRSTLSEVTLFLP